MFSKLKICLFNLKSHPEWYFRDKPRAWAYYRNQKKTTLIFSTRYSSCFRWKKSYLLIILCKIYGHEWKNQRSEAMVKVPEVMAGKVSASIIPPVYRCFYCGLYGVRSNNYKITSSGPDVLLTDG